MRQAAGATRRRRSYEGRAMTYQQLSLDERHQIRALRSQSVSWAEIARRLGRHRSTILREVRRNSVERIDGVIQYHAGQAHGRAHARRVAKGVQQRRIQGELRTLVEQKLRLSWSPEQISGRLWLERGDRLSAETIYQHVIRDAFEQRGGLRYCLRFGGYKKHRLRRSRHAARTRARKNHISQRPAAANDRSEVGHWERDCVLGPKGGPVVLTLVERRTRYTRFRRVGKLDTAAVAAATVEALRPYAASIKSVTNDNGVEFQRDAALASRLRVPIYFCDPSSPWQRGTVENVNGLLRQYLPKHASMPTLTDALTTALEDTLNYRPRKILGYRTPHEAFFGEVTPLLKGDLMRFGLEFSPET
jgi:IS30 family transposase